MRIVFLCGSLEPGRDGVGDYIRRLAGQLIRKGHKASIVALNDKFIESDLEGFQYTDAVSISMLRIPSIWLSKRKFKHAENYIETFDPDFLSLQFVPFSFNSRGVPFSLGKRLRLLAKGKPWHIMFHELWVGMDENASFKYIIWGKFQRLLIQSLINNLQPKAVHTQTKLYQSLLAKLGIKAKFLPLFSNIPLIKKCQGSGGQESNRLIKQITLVLFGAINGGAPVEKFAHEASTFSRENKIQINLIIVGRSGIEQNHWVETWKSVGLCIELLGEQTSENISKLLRNCSFGISTTPIALAEKSGTIAAMLEHGLPVICVRNAWKAIGIKELSFPSGVLEYKEGCLKALFEMKIHVESNNTLEVIGLKFAEDVLEL